MNDINAASGYREHHSGIVQGLRGGDLTTVSPEISTEQPLQGTGLHDPKRGVQAWSDSNSFHKRGGQKMSPGGDIFVPFHSPR